MHGYFYVDCICICTYINHSLADFASLIHDGFSPSSPHRTHPKSMSKKSPERWRTLASDLMVNRHRPQVAPDWKFWVLHCLVTERFYGLPSAFLRSAVQTKTIRRRCHDAWMRYLGQKKEVSHEKGKGTRNLALHVTFLPSTECKTQRKSLVEHWKVWRVVPPMKLSGASLIRKFTRKVTE
jgi:hypothetical protein